MKKIAFTFLAVLTTVLTFTNCKKDDTVHNVYFWTSSGYEKQLLTLFADDQAIWQLPHYSTELTCSNESLKQRRFL
jgi:hypothetical protein